MELLTIEEVAEKLKVSKRTVYEWIRSGRLEAVKAGSLWRIPTEALEKFLKRPEEEDLNQEGGKS